ncbi:hypothetical protein DPSP01_005503 [Paraphaeosphaeria sporulosa]|uniref:Secreted protein n=1 Tax=Paraphaeosphaeria sporulosa TaxID=1460663 RepID=A0A177CUL4_9PLEO|nr:uncharacterized protein CC84DRAFT_1213912 [Paraphaeosphaeria sporulosa]OAG10602.1 hypothetical protein CC84DRAFT_1213912 [Paraphaeosphaeria sporulosa]
MYFKSLAAFLPAVAVALPTTTPIVHRVAKAIVARAPPEANVVLKSVTASGTGCSGNSASFVLGIGDGATVGFDNMIVDSTQIDKTKRCVITLDLQLDSKWKYTINKATNVRGYVENDGGTYKVAYTVGGKTSDVSNSIPSNPSGGNWVDTSTSPGITSAYGGGVANIDILLRLLPAGTQVATATIDSLDIQFEYSK